MTFCDVPTKAVDGWIRFNLKKAKFFNMAVTETGLDPKVWKMSITF